MSLNSDPLADTQPMLRLRDTVSMIVGIVIGSAIYVIPSSVAESTGSTSRLLSIWLAGGVLSMLGAMCYAELASADPRSGGDFNYLSSAFGRRFGLVYGWAQLSVIIPGNIAVMSFVFAQHAGRFIDGNGTQTVSAFRTCALSLIAVAALTAINLFGTVTSKFTQNVLTLLKIIGLSLILVAGYVAVAPTGNPEASSAAVKEPDAAQAEAAEPNYALALIFCMFAYAGWAESAYVASEVRDARRNVPLALLLGIGGITVTYLLINVAYVHGLGFDGLRESQAGASDLVVRAFGPIAGHGMNALVAISALGAMQGMVFAGSRMVAVVGEGHRFLGPLGRLNSRRSPGWAIVVISGIAALAIITFASDLVRGPLRSLLLNLTDRELDWGDADDALETLVESMAPIVWLYFALTAVAVIVLRRRHGTHRATFRTPGYPVTPIVFAATCLWMVYRGILYTEWMTLVVLAPMLLGLPLILIGCGSQGVAGNDRQINS